MRQVDTLLARFPGPVTLNMSRLKLLVRFALLLGLAVFSAYLPFAKPEFDWYEKIMSVLAALFLGNSCRVVNEPMMTARDPTETSAANLQCSAASAACRF